MSSPAYALERSDRTRRRARIRRLADVSRTVARRSLPWSDVALASTAHARPGSDGAGRHTGLGGLALVALVIAAHLVIVWFVLHHRAAVPTRPQKREVSIALERPPQPPPPRKIEPPKPPPPRPQRIAEPVPRIEQTPPARSDLPPAPSPEPPVAVAPVAAASPPPPPPLPVTPPLGRAGYLNNPAPPYPPVAARLGLEGTVLLRVRVMSSGRVESVAVIKSSGSKPLDEAAVVTVRTWLFTPSKRGETPIDGWATVPIEFKLDQ